ncbi:ATP-binding protein [Listeria monocytogenes]|nr:ATP-binding protein [Listeria monocytogenes]EJE0355403.1 ATP-binding protein [Listeria monocytogenes]
MLLKTPYKSINKNLMLTKSGELWAYYRIAPENINNGDSKRREKNKVKFRNFLEQLEKYKDFHLEMYPRQMELDKRNKELEKDFHSTTKNIGKYYNEETLRILKKELGLITKSSFVLGVKLKDNLLTNADDAKTVLRNSITSVTDSLMNVLGLSREVTEEFYEKFLDIEKELYQLVISISGSRLTEEELVYINRYNFVRDVSHSIDEETEKQGVVNITDAIIDPSTPGYLKIETSGGTRWISFVVVDKLGLDMNYSHLYEKAQNLPFPVELHIKGQFQNKDAVIRKTAMVKTRMKQMHREQHKVGEEAEDSVLNSRFVLNRLQNQLNGGNQKFIHWVSSFVVTGKSKEECHRRVKQTERIFKNRKITVVRPLADQLQLFYKFLPGQPLMFEKNWIQKTTCVGFAENLFAVSQQLGNNVGFYIGRINKYKNNLTLKDSIASSRDIVLFHPFIANKGIEGAVTDSPHISITGETGKGKSFLVKLLLIYLSMLNINALYIDPKSEIEVWFKKVVKNVELQKKYPLFVQLLESILYAKLDANDPKNHGVLDPIVMLEGTDAKDTAQSIIEQIYNMDNKDDVKKVFLESLTEIIEKRSKGEKVGFMNVIDMLREHADKNIKDAGDLLFQQIQNSVLQLNFSYGETDGLNLNGKVNVLGIEGLDLPDAKTDPRYYSDAEKKSLAIMIPLAKFCEKFGSKDKNQETVEIFDEGWMLTSARAGKKLVKSMRRVGRSYNNALVLVTQSVGDVNTEDDNGNFGVNFAFDEPSETEDILDFLNMENSEANKELISNMIKGECLFKDIYGRTGKLAVDCLFEEWKEAFKTVTTNNSAKAEKLFS